MLFASGMAAAAALLLTQPGPGRSRSRSTPAATTACAHSPRPTSRRAASSCGWRRPPSWRSAAQGARPALARVALEPEARGLRHRRAGRARASPTVVDNTTAGPLLQRPLDLGARLRPHERDQADERPRRPHARLRRHARRRARAGAARLAHATPGPSPARSRPGSRTARCRRSRCGWSAAATTRSRSRGCSPPATTWSAVRYPGLPERPRSRGRPAPDARLSERSSRSTLGSARAGRALPGERPSWSPTPPASAASTPPPSGAAAGAATT